MLQKRFTGKTTECSRHLRHSAIEKYILSKLNRCIFQISLKYIKLIVPKILFILVLCSFNFYFKITWPPPPTTKLAPTTPVKTFLKLFSPPFFWEGRGVAGPENGKIVWKHGLYCQYFRLNLKYLEWQYRAYIKTAKNGNFLGTAQEKWLWGYFSQFLFLWPWCQSFSGCSQDNYRSKRVSQLFLVC